MPISSKRKMHKYSYSPCQLQRTQIKIFGKTKRQSISIYRMRISLRNGNFITVIDFDSSHIQSDCGVAPFHFNGFCILLAISFQYKLTKNLIQSGKSCNQNNEPISLRCRRCRRRRRNIIACC